MMEGEPGADVPYLEAGRAAVRLLKEMSAMLPLRSDVPKIREEIARIEKIFDGPARR